MLYKEHLTRTLSSVCRALSAVLIPVQPNFFKIQTLGVDSRVMRHIPQQSCVLQKVDKLGVCWRRWDLQSTDEAKMEELLQVPVSYVLVAANEPDDLRARKNRSLSRLIF